MDVVRNMVRNMVWCRGVMWCVCGVVGVCVRTQTSCRPPTPANNRDKSKHKRSSRVCQVAVGLSAHFTRTDTLRGSFPSSLPSASETRMASSVAVSSRGVRNSVTVPATNTSGAFPPQPFQSNFAPSDKRCGGGSQAASAMLCRWRGFVVSSVQD